ncbi:uncharacterized protein PHALS_15246 [Plasmopara halstedii]|uniref:Uncharacterized protein n=1 Tax=Plasmopara halstedii TaxID=4781 RepID=A0A0P1B561_PLAHL|nr:uncharacterized protein PHALS_15246 [Plasmopara halstedii]CEG49932.1 hypothetical protein PHALS_15246 [Plasmopara halstedii]|eukprot:XP_024586301.1 hypothetical protein PHALS_15246 [Plasmopara halstedii]
MYHDPRAEALSIETFSFHCLPRQDEVNLYLILILVKKSRYEINSISRDSIRIQQVEASTSMER